MISEHLFFHGVLPPPKTRPVSSPDARPSSPVEWSDHTREFFQVLFEGAGLPMDPYRSSALQRRAPACLRFLGVPSLEAGRRKLQARPELASAAMNAVLLGVTEFCRDQAVFEHLGETLRAEWSERAGPRRIWSAACSDGRELYSVALLLAEAGLLEEAQLLGTDCRPEAIAQARAGIFGPEALADLDPVWRAHYFAPGSSARAIQPTVRARVQWKTADLFAGAEPGPWDLILWRNMAIYLEPAATEGIWADLLAELGPGGYLVTGKADHPPQAAALERIASCIYRKKEER